ncbi:hypothetical protein cyc_08965 [Cyclospora cayetanensis]|uniref:PH domain-containing protein n=1 Tax=Cyclospora cayetanensis TaxID=88456 RepID=A0A1D3D8M3_9EIME|nr:hypothetical protein cyc_08965 [Cyclospora cayetanensis]
MQKEEQRNEQQARHISGLSMPTAVGNAAESSRFARPASSNSSSKESRNAGNENSDSSALETGQSDTETAAIAETAVSSAPASDHHGRLQISSLPQGFLRDSNRLFPQQQQFWRCERQSHDSIRVFSTLASSYNEQDEDLQACPPTAKEPYSHGDSARPRSSAAGTHAAERAYAHRGSKGRLVMSAACIPEDFLVESPRGTLPRASTDTEGLSESLGNLKVGIDSMAEFAALAAAPSRTADSSGELAEGSFADSSEGRNKTTPETSEALGTLEASREVPSSLIHISDPLDAAADTAVIAPAQREPAFVANPRAISKKSFQKLVTKQFAYKSLPISAIRIGRAFNGYMLEDPTGELDLARLPFIHGSVNVAPLERKPSLHRSLWASRYLVLHQGQLFWFGSRRDYLSLGLDGCLGSLSLIINTIQMELDAKYNTRFTLYVGEWFSMVIDTAITNQDRGAWVVHILACQNTVSPVPNVVIMCPSIEPLRLCIAFCSAFRLPFLLVSDLHCSMRPPQHCPPYILSEVALRVFDLSDTSKSPSEQRACMTAPFRVRWWGAGTRARCISRPIMARFPQEGCLVEGLCRLRWEATCVCLLPAAYVRATKGERIRKCYPQVDWQSLQTRCRLVTAQEDLKGDFTLEAFSRVKYVRTSFLGAPQWLEI